MDKYKLILEKEIGVFRHSGHWESNGFLGPLSLF